MSSLPADQAHSTRTPAVAAWANVALASVLLVIVSPLLLLVAVTVRLSSHGRVLERRPHRAPDGRRVDLLAFRTTLDGARTSHHQRVRSAIGDDATPLTSVGRPLRALRLDRLPRLWNVAAGHVRLL